MIRDEILDSGSGEQHDCGGPLGLPDGGQKHGGETPLRGHRTPVRAVDLAAITEATDQRQDSTKGRIESGEEPKSPSLRANPCASVWTQKSACDKVQGGDAGDLLFGLPATRRLAKGVESLPFPLRSSTPSARKSTVAAGPSAQLATQLRTA